MADDSAELVVPPLLALLREAIEGPSGSSSWFTDNSPSSGLLGETHALDSGDSLAGAIAALAHVAAHLGAIRQKIQFAREAPG